MTPRGRQHWTQAGRAVPAAATVLTGLGLAGLLWPRPAWRPPNRPHEPVNPAAETLHVAPTLADLALVWQRDLRQALFELASPEPVVATSTPPPAIRLLGTAVEGRQRFGLFQLAGDTTVVKPVGAQVDGMEIVAIARGWARLRSGMREFELTVPWYERLRGVEAADDR